MVDFLQSTLNQTVINLKYIGLRCEGRGLNYSADWAHISPDVF